MKLRHAAALALVGWYLLIPPLESCLGSFYGRPCEQTPLRKWRRSERTYDSRAKCEEMRNVWVEKARLYLRESVNDRPQTTRMGVFDADYAAWLAATCVATDDPRLKEK